MSISEVKVHAIWSIKKETILNITEDGDIKSEKFKTVLPNVQYFFCFQFVNDEFVIYIDGNGDMSVKEIKCFIASDNIERFGDSDQIVTIAKREELLNPENNFFVNDILTVEIRGILCFDTPKFDLLNNLWKKDDKDFTFVVDKRTVKAHKLIIRECSAVFAAAIDSDSNVMKIKNFGYCTVEAAVKLCYDWLDHYYSNKNAFEIIKFASAYDMPLIKNKVEYELKSRIDEETVCEFANKSLEYKAEILLGFCVNFLSECIKNGKSFDGTLANLNSEVKVLVFNNLFPKVKISS